METRTVTQRLALAEGRIQHCDAHLKRQRSLLKHLEHYGLGTINARRQLKELEDTQACFVAYRDRLKSEMDLAASNQAPVSWMEKWPEASQNLATSPQSKIEVAAGLIISGDRRNGGR